MQTLTLVADRGEGGDAGDAFIPSFDRFPVLDRPLALDLLDVTVRLGPDAGPWPGPRPFFSAFDPVHVKVRAVQSPSDAVLRLPQTVLWPRLRSITLSGLMCHKSETLATLASLCRARLEIELRMPSPVAAYTSLAGDIEELRWCDKGWSLSVVTETSKDAEALPINLMDFEGWTSIPSGVSFRSLEHGEAL